MRNFYEPEAFMQRYALGVRQGNDRYRGTEAPCPIFLFEGRHDWNVPSTLAANWFEHIKAPTSRLVWFENSAHMPMIEEPGHFLLHLVSDVRPLATD